MASQAQIEAAAAAIANARAGRRGAPPISNVLDMLKRMQGGKLYNEVMEDAKAALAAAEPRNEFVATMQRHQDEWDAASIFAAVDPGMKEMEPDRVVHGTQDQWAAPEDRYRFGWNACRAQMLNRLEAVLKQRSAISPKP